MVEQLPVDFVNAMKAILMSVDNEPHKLTEAMNIAEKDKRMDAYYTFEAELAYYTYINIKDKDNMETPTINALNKIKENLDILSSGNSNNK